MKIDRIRQSAIQKDALDAASMCGVSISDKSISDKSTFDKSTFIDSTGKEFIVTVSESGKRAGRTPFSAFHITLIIGIAALIGLVGRGEPVQAMVPIVNPAAADTRFISGRWLEEPNLSMSYVWNLFERRDGWYIENWSDAQIDAIDGFQFGAREVFKLMGLSNLIDTNYEGDAWVQIQNVATNDPEGSNEFPPHFNIVSYWGETDQQYDGGINGNFYTTTEGKLNPTQTWYAWHTEPVCERGEREPEADEWVSHLARDCSVLWQMRVTTEGELQLRRGEQAPVYTVRSETPTLMQILRDDELIRSVERVFHNAWVNYPEPHPEGSARVVWEIRDFEAEILTTETITARPDTGRILSHERVETLLDGTTPPGTEMLYLPQLER